MNKPVQILVLMLVALSLSRIVLAQEFMFTHQTVSDSIISPHRIDVGDVDNDGDLDLLIVSLTGTAPDVYLLLKEGAGYQQVSLTDTLDQASDGKFCDLDQDGDLDIVVGERDGNRVLWFENESMNFTPHMVGSGTSILWGFIASSMRDIETVDLDQDGDIDVLAAAFISKGVFFFENDGNQQFSRHTIVIDSTLWGYLIGSYGLSVVDLDQDGLLDIMVTVPSINEEVVWLRQTGVMDFEVLSLRSGVQAYGVNVNDIDLDGDLDVLTTLPNDDRVELMINDGSQNFTPMVIDSMLPGAYAVEVADLNMDNIMDVVASASADSASDGVYAYDGAMFFQRTALINERGARGLVLVDEDEDSDIDIFCVYFNANRAVFSQNDPLPSAVTQNIHTPAGFRLRQNYPNPFNPTTTISYNLDQKARVTLDIYNSKGQRIRTLVKGNQNPGEYQYQWDGRDEKGYAVASGVYIYRLQANEKSQTRKMILMR